MDAVAQFFQSIPYDQLIIQTMNGIVTGMILALVASGLTLIFGIMDVVNFAHGELFMLGAYIGVIVLVATGSFWLALILATLMVAMLGAALADRDAAAADRPRSAQHDPGHLRHFADLAELRALAVRTVVAQDQRADHQPLQSVLSRISLVPAADRRAVGRSSSAASGCSSNTASSASGSAPPRRTASWRRPWAFRCRWVLHRRVRHRRRHGGGERRAVRRRWSASTTPWGSTGC